MQIWRFKDSLEKWAVNEVGAHLVATSLGKHGEDPKDDKTEGIDTYFLSKTCLLAQVQA
jgi:hypothetical protein